MSAYEIRDGADEFRIELTGNFANGIVREVEVAWKTALNVNAPRRNIIDISRMTGYDSLGRRLLSMMYRHGMQFAAGTPESLVFLSEIAGPPRRIAAFAAENAAPPKAKQFPPLAPLAAVAGSR